MTTIRLVQQQSSQEEDEEEEEETEESEDEEDEGKRRWNWEIRMEAGRIDDERTIAYSRGTEINF